MDRRGQRLAAVSVFGALALNYPLMTLASSDGTLLGVPVLYLYLFVWWAVLIGVMAFVIERRR
ncbi:MAG: hypothetical protein P1T08_13370 [Acidimicrobiia bacterium]|nr:hypothetical protein [Acidimicrobiia bacterium]